MAYCVGTFVVFSLAFALIRRQCNKQNKKVNIKKEIKKRFKSVIGNDPDNLGTGGNNRSEQNERFVDEESKREEIPRGMGNNSSPKKDGMLNKLAGRFGFNKKMLV